MMLESGELYVPTPEEIRAECEQIQSEWTARERLNRGRVTLTSRVQSEYLYQPRKRRSVRKRNRVFELQS